jgi:hypothetical protein
MDPQCSSVEAHIFNAKVCSLAASQTVAIHHQEQQMIPTALASCLGRFKKGLNLGWIKEILPPIRSVILSTKPEVVSSVMVSVSLDFCAVPWRYSQQNCGNVERPASAWLMDGGGAKLGLFGRRVGAPQIF